jgi:hypothetical protein
MKNTYGIGCKLYAKKNNNRMSCTYTTVLCCICATLWDIYTSYAAFSATQKTNDRQLTRG